MLATAEIQPETEAKSQIPPISVVPNREPTNAKEGRKRGKRYQTEESKRYRLRQAVLLAESLMESAAKMREQVSQSAPANETPAQTEARMIAERAAAGVLSRIAMSWRTLADGIRELKGEALPGQKRPIPDELKQPKVHKSNLPPDEV